MTLLCYLYSCIIRLLILFDFIFQKIVEEYFFQNWSVNPIHLLGQNPYESIYGLHVESEYISFFAIEYEYNYPVKDMDHRP